jgi:RNA-directed DNA polymerase
MSYSIKPAKLIVMLNPVIRGWCNYHKHVVSKKTFNKLDSYIFKLLWRWAKRNHQNKPRQWVVDKYFNTIIGSKWLFSGLLDNKYRVTLFRAWHTPITRHVLIKGKANPFDPDWDSYFTNRARKRVTSPSVISRNG